MTTGDLRADRRVEVGLALLAAGEPAAAAEAFRAALELAPGSAAAWFALGEAAEAAGERETAVDAFRRCCRLAPDDALGAGPRLALLGAAPPPERLPAAHVAQLFDEYAPRFDRALADGLGYAAPERLRAALLAEARGCGDLRLGRWRVLDLGCGTGLAGVALRDLAGRLDGIDLSEGMLARARRRRLYDSLERGDLVTALADAGPGYDLIVAADVLIYLGDLSGVFSGAARRLVPGGRFAVTLEKAEAPGWHLQPCRRYAHHPSTVAAWSAAAGLEIAHWEEAALRTEGGRPVPSLLYILKRAGHDTEADAALLPAAGRGRDRPDA